MAETDWRRAYENVRRENESLRAQLYVGGSGASRLRLADVTLAETARNLRDLAGHLQRQAETAAHYARIDPEHVPAERVVWIDYTNHRGERRWRAIAPLERLSFEETPDHKPAQWILRAWSIDKQAERSFAFEGIHGVSRVKPVGAP